jgi:poly(A) polymerase
MLKRLLPKKKPQNQHRHAEQEHGIKRSSISHAALDVVDSLQAHKYQALIVGGSVRDLLMGLTPKDYDVATDARPEQITRVLPRSRIIGRRFKIVHARSGRDVIEVTTFRGHHDKKVQRGQHAKQSSSGLLVRDNVYGNLEEDAKRRDFSCNSIYYNPADGSLLDYCGGLEDIRHGRLQTIGDPHERFREDPVRMLRAVRFEAKLGLTLDDESKEALLQNTAMIQEVAPARLFDEIIKILLTPYAEKALNKLVETGLFAQLFPATAERLDEDPRTLKLLQAAMKNTASRLTEDKRVAPFFMYAVILWPAVRKQFSEFNPSSGSPQEAMDRAGRWVLDRQSARILIPKRFSLPMQDMWRLQVLLENRQPNKALRTLGEDKFRAAYDLLLLREQSGEALGGLGQWWTEFQFEANANGDVIATPAEAPKKRRNRRRGNRSKPA